MSKILYIGENAEFSEGLRNGGMTEVLHVANVVGLHNNLGRLSNFDLVVSDENLKGLSGLGIFERYKAQFNESLIPYCLILDHPDKYLRLSLLRAGISEVIPIKSDPSILGARAPFLRSMLKARLSVAEISKPKEYRIPTSKRVFDIIVASFALLLFSPLLIIVAILIKLESKGPIGYTSKRVGTGYKVFDFYKLRSMYVDADQRMADMKHLNQYAIAAQEKEVSTVLPLSKESGPTLIYKDGQPMSEEEYLIIKRKQQAGTFVKFVDDPRITKVGKFIRNTSIDELPQLLNVLKGDMSIVGNRPLPLYEAEQLTSDDWGERFLAPAGITGLWQVMKRGKGEMSEEERKGLDNQYARKVSLWNDIRLILRTIPALFQKENV